MLLMGYVEWNFPSESVANSKSMILELDEMACRLTMYFLRILTLLLGMRSLLRDAREMDLQRHNQ